MGALAVTTGRSTISQAWAPQGRPLAHMGLAASAASMAHPCFPREARLSGLVHSASGLAQGRFTSSMTALLYRLMRVNTEGLSFHFTAHVALRNCTHTKIGGRN